MRIQRSAPGVGSETGQAMILSIFLLSLMVITVPAIVQLNQVTAHRGSDSNKKRQGRALAEEGIAYAKNILSMRAHWDAARAGNSASLGFDGNTIFKATRGGCFTVRCSTGGSGLAPYQMSVEATAVFKDKNGQEVPVRVLEAVMSRKTVSAELANGQSAAGALAVASSAPVVTATPGAALTVHWGPVLSFDTVNLWTLRGAMDSTRYPRKFVQAGVTGPTYLRAAGPNNMPTDNHEYWAYTSLGFQPFLFLDAYRGLAQGGTGVPAPTSLVNGTPLVAVPPGSGYFVVPVGDTAVFDSYTYASSTQVIYVQGNAQVRDLQVDLRSQGALMVEGNLTLLSPSGASGLFEPSLRVPPDSPLEYPYNPSENPCPIPLGQQDQSCTIAGSRIHFRGFLYATGDVTVQSSLTPWRLAGTVRVDGQLTVDGPLTIYYDDEINRMIETMAFELQIDSVNELPSSTI